MPQETLSIWRVVRDLGLAGFNYRYGWWGLAWLRRWCLSESRQCTVPRYWAGGNWCRRGVVTGAGGKEWGKLGQAASQRTLQRLHFSVWMKRRDLARLFIYHSNPSLRPQRITLKKLKLNSFMKTYKIVRTHTQKRCPFHYRGLECKRWKSRNTWSNRQIWPWNAEWRRAKTNRVLPRKCTGQSKHPLQIT